MLLSLPSNVSSSLRLELTTLMKICEKIDTPRSLAVALLCANGEWGQYLMLPMDYSESRNPRQFALDYLVTEIMRKSEHLPLGINKAQVAVDSFYESEAHCLSTNNILRAPLDAARSNLIWKCQQEVQRIIGPLTTADLNNIIMRSRHGSGATTGIKGSGSVLSDKFDGEIHLTADLVPYFRQLLGSNWHSYAKFTHQVVDGSKFTTVPKNAKTDRGICIEPTLNMFFQLGVGTILKDLLMRSGINLRSQKRNQYLAKMAYVKKLATIDLSAASDTVSWECVAALLPPRWLHLLCLSRSKSTLVNGEKVILEKFSSMGNGYTFELETLIFVSVIKSVVPASEHHNCNAYGDDLIVPQEYASDVIDALNLLGFKVNDKKSFLAGSFFESCGSDWFLGTNVRPFYLRKSEDGDSMPYSLRIANMIRLYCKQLGHGQYCDDIFREIWHDLYQQTPKMYRNCKIPGHFGDAGFIMSKLEAKPKRLNFSQEGYEVKFIVQQPIKKRKHSYGVLFAALARLGPANNDRSPFRATYLQAGTDIFTKGYEPLRGYLGKPKTSVGSTQCWTDGLLWCSVNSDLP